MSCILYLIYILDIPTLFHKEKHTLENTDNCKKPSIQTFVDDLMNTIYRESGKPLQESVEGELNKIEEYMQSNLLSLNRDKTQIMVLNKDPILQTQINIPAEPKNIMNQNQMLFLGVTISDRLTWNTFLMDGKANLHKQLQARISSIKKIHIHKVRKKNLANAIFMSKMYYAAELWGGAPNYIKSKFKSLQLEEAKSALGYTSIRWSKNKLLAAMGWMDVEQILGFTSNKLSYKIMHWKVPKLLHVQFFRSRNSNKFLIRLSGPHKMGPRPNNVGHTKLTKNHYRAKVYHFYSKIPQDIQNLSNFTHFSKWLKKYYLYGSKTAFEKLPRFSPSIEGTTFNNNCMT